MFQYINSIFTICIKRKILLSAHNMWTNLWAISYSFCDECQYARQLTYQSSIYIYIYQSWTKISLTPLRTGAKIVKATSQRATITSTVLLRLNTRRNAMGLLIARYLSILMAVIVNTEAATATPMNTNDYSVRQ